MTHHRLDLVPAHLHGRLHAGIAPVLTVHSGDTVELATLDAHWYHPDQPALADDLAGGALTEWEHDGVRDPGHALVGPIAVAGAQPGDAVVVSILEVVPGGWGWTRTGGWSSWANDGCGTADGPGELLRWRLADSHGVDQHGDVVVLRPFLGVVGLCPGGEPEPGAGVGEDGRAHSTVPPRRVGGNLDCRELVVGSTLVLPVEVPGGLLSVGDGHATQGDGEVGGTALECPMTRVLLRVELRRGAGTAMRAPVASTPAGEVTFGVDPDLRAATLQALNGVVDLLVARHGTTRARALALCSVAVDLRVTQVANRTHGVHAVLDPARLRVGPGAG